MEGVKQVKKTDLNPLLVFVMPPSIEELERRLRARNTEQEEALRKRLESACKEMIFGKGIFSTIYSTWIFYFIIHNVNKNNTILNHIFVEKKLK